MFAEFSFKLKIVTSCKISKKNFNQSCKKKREKLNLFVKN